MSGRNISIVYIILVTHTDSILTNNNLKQLFQKLLTLNIYSTTDINFNTR